MKHAILRPSSAALVLQVNTVLWGFLIGVLIVDAAVASPSGGPARDESQDNLVRSNREDGVFFRNETEGMAGHRNRLERNVIENNGREGNAAGIRIRGETRDLVFRDNLIRDTRPPGERRQLVGIKIEEAAGAVVLEGNQVAAKTTVQDLRKSGSKP